MRFERIPPEERYWNDFYQWRIVDTLKDLGVHPPPSGYTLGPAFRKRLEEKDWDLDRFGDSSEFQWFFLLDGEFVAEAELTHIRRDVKIGEITYGTKEEYRGRGIATKAVAELIAEIFERGLLRKLVAKVRVDNIASQKILEDTQKLGFTCEGTFRDDFLIGGRYFDMKIYGLLSKDWPAGKEKRFVIKPAPVRDN